MPDGRTGVRSRDDALAVARAVAESPRLALAGVAGFEGTVGHDRSPATRERVADFLAVRPRHVRRARRCRPADAGGAGRDGRRQRLLRPGDRDADAAARPRGGRGAAQRLLPHPRQRLLRAGLARRRSRSGDGTSSTPRSRCGVVCCPARSQTSHCSTSVVATCPSTWDCRRRCGPRATVSAVRRTACR